MQELHLVGFTTDQRHLIFSARRGAKSGSFLVPVNDEVLAAIEQLTSVADVEAGDEVDAAPAKPDQPATRVESGLTVREIQARLRAGDSVAVIAKAAGVDVEWVERFAPPIRAEQQRIVEQALAAHLHRPRVGDSVVNLRRAVAMAMAEREVVFTVDGFDTAWSSRMLGADQWIVEFEFSQRGRRRTVGWQLDTTTGQVTTTDRTAALIGFVVNKADLPPASSVVGAAPASRTTVRPPLATRSGGSAKPGSSAAKRTRPVAPKVPLTPAERAAAKAAAAEAKRVETARLAAEKKAAAAAKVAAKAAERKRVAAEKVATQKAAVAAKKAAVKQAAAEKKAAAKAAAVAKKAATNKAAAKPTATKPTATKAATAKTVARKRAVAKSTKAPVEAIEPDEAFDEVTIDEAALGPAVEPASDLEPTDDGHDDEASAEEAAIEPDPIEADESADDFADDDDVAVEDEATEAEPPVPARSQRTPVPVARERSIAVDDERQSRALARVARENPPTAATQIDDPLVRLRPGAGRPVDPTQTTAMPRVDIDPEPNDDAAEAAPAVDVAEAAVERRERVVARSTPTAQFRSGSAVQAGADGATPATNGSAMPTRPRRREPIRVTGPRREAPSPDPADDAAVTAPAPNPAPVDSGAAGSGEAVDGGRRRRRQLRAK